MATNDIAKMHPYVFRLIANFLQRLRDTPEGDGNMLDRTLVLWSSAHPHASHSTKNYPIQLAGGGKLGLKYGYLHDFVGAKKVPLDNDAQCRRCSRQIFRRMYGAHDGGHGTIRLIHGNTRI